MIENKIKMKNENVPLVLKYTKVSKFGDFSLSRLNKMISNYHQTTEHLFRNPNFKKVI